MKSDYRFMLSAPKSMESNWVHCDTVQNENFLENNKNVENNLALKNFVKISDAGV